MHFLYSWSNHGPKNEVFAFWGDSHLFVFFLYWTKYGKDHGEEDETVEEAKETDHEEDLEERDKDVRLGGDQ